MSVLRLSAASSFVPPNNQRSLLYAFAVLEITATLGVLVLLVVGACTKRLRANTVLLNLELVFLVTAAGQSLLVWTGHSFDMDPPRGLCLVSGSFIAAAASMKSGAAFALTCKVWAHTMNVAHPRSSLLLIASSSLALSVVAWAVGLPLFFGALITGLRDRFAIQHTSVYYCLHSSPGLTVANMAIGAILELLSLILSGWTAWLVTRVRRRLYSLGASPNSPIHYSLIIRTLIFSFVIFLALAIELFVALADVTVPVPGMTLAVVDFAAFAIFVTDPVLFRSMSRRVRGKVDTSFASGSSTTPRPTRVSVHIESTRHACDDNYQDSHMLTPQTSKHPIADRFVIIAKVDDNAYWLEEGVSTEDISK